MHLYQRSIVLLTGAAALLLAGCTGSSSQTGEANVRCTAGGTFCLVSCDLGCGAASCAVTEVAENQRLQFVFNQPIDPNSVSVGSFSLRTTAGETPEGQLQVDGRAITFVPSISVTNGVSSFGFRRNESYVLTLLGGSQGGIKSVSGLILPRSYTCTITATRGIVDEDNSPPIATLVAPTNLDAAPTTATIVIRFSEVIDTTPFLQPISASTPIQYVLRRSRVPAGGTRECDLDSEAIQLDGLPRIGLEQVNGRPVTTISLKPTLTLPGQSCVEVRVTGDVRDLAGRAAEERTFRFLTEASLASDTLLTEVFSDEGRMDTNVSGGTWQNGAHAAFVGGDGRHGTFRPTDGNPVAGAFVWSTDSQVIPADVTFSGVEETVLDGRFFFTDFVVPEGTIVRFAGTNPARIFVRGRVEIRGVVTLNGADQVLFNAHNPVPTSQTTPTPGQPGTAGGAGGAPGGRGGDRCLGLGAQPNNDGQNGGDLALVAGHAYAAQAVGTGGRGSPIFPAHGNDTLLAGPPTTWTITANLINGAVGSGGGGGGYNGPGGAPRNTTPATVNQVLTPTFASPGIAFNPLPIPAGRTSLEHFLIGGAGGGGGGSHPFAGFNVAAPPFVFDRWKAGGGGTGGGGALAIRGGRSVTVFPTGRIEAKGGNGVNYNGDNPGTTNQDTLNTSNQNWGVACPGGAGSGGTVLLQADRDVEVQGQLVTTGGTGSQNSGCQPQPPSPPPNFGIQNFAGDGAVGFYRLEARNLVSVSGTGSVPVFVAAQNAGTLTDRDALSGARSLWRSSTFVFPPEYLRYELDVDTDGDGTVDVTYSDDLPGSVPANDPLGPVRVRFQGARVSAGGDPDPGTIRNWRDFVSSNAGIALNGDAATGFRFELIFNNTGFPNAVVRRLTVVVRG